MDVHWRRADFPPPSDQDDDAQQPAVFSLRVGDWRRSDALPLGSPALSGAFARVFSCRQRRAALTGTRTRPTPGCFVRVWQSVDCSLVVTIATDRHAASAGDASQLYQLSLAPAPAVDSGLAAAVTSLRFDFSVQAPAQSMEPWQLLDLARGLHVHHLLLNLGSAVSVLVFHVRQEEVADDDGRRRSLPFSVDSPRGLGISHFAQSWWLPRRWQCVDHRLTGVAACAGEWYYSPEFPIEFHKERVERATMTDRSGARLAVQVEVCWMLAAVPSLQDIELTRTPSASRSKCWTWRSSCSGSSTPLRRCGSPTSSTTTSDSCGWVGIAARGVAGAARSHLALVHHHRSSRRRRHYL